MSTEKNATEAARSLGVMESWSIGVLELKDVAQVTQWTQIALKICQHRGIYVLKNRSVWQGLSESEVISPLVFSVDETENSALRASPILLNIKEEGIRV